MAVVGIFATVRLAGTADIKTMRDINVNELAGVFRNPSTDQAKILFLITARCPRIDKRRFAGHQLIKTDDSLRKF